MRAPYDGLTAVRQTDQYLRGKFCGAKDEVFSYCVHSAVPHVTGRSVPDSPDPDMKGCRIDLRKKADSQ